MSKWVLFARGIVAALVGGLFLGIAVKQVLPAVTGEDLRTLAAAGAAVCGLAYSIGHFQGVETEHTYSTAYRKWMHDHMDNSQSERNEEKGDRKDA